MKILLISNPTSRRQRPDFPPLGIAYLGTIAKKEGHEVMLIDGGLRTISYIISEARKYSPDLVGVTCWTIDRGLVWKLCTALKEVIPKAFLVLGGPHATMYPNHMFEKTHASAVVLGEGEETFTELLAALGERGDLTSVAGIVLKGKDGGVYHTSRRPRIKDTSSIPFPYYSGFKKFDFSMYNGFPWLPRPTAAIISSRGCVFGCAYCASVRFWGRRWRSRSPEDVLAEIKWLVEKFGIRSIFFYDDNFPVNKKRVVAICEGIRNNDWNLKWSCCSNVKMLNRDLLEVMKDSGCVSIDFGVESGSDKILKNINKPQTTDDIIETFDLVHKAGIATRAYLMVGCPGENKATIDETIELVGRIKPLSSGAKILWLLPGTPIYEDAVKNGFISEDYWLKFDEVPYNIQEHSLKELETLRTRLMVGIGNAKGGINSRIAYQLKDFYYKYPFLSIFRSLVPRQFR